MGGYIRVNTTGLERKKQAVVKKINADALGAVEDLGKAGRDFAKSIAPHRTGRTASFIKLFISRGPDGPTAKVQAQNPTVGGANRFDKTKFSLVRWMHLTGGVYHSYNPFGPSPKHIISGDPKFMYTTRDYLNRIKKGVATGRFKDIKFK